MNLNLVLYGSVGANKKIFGGKNQEHAYCGKKPG